jgi:hypothetical protein
VAEAQQALRQLGEDLGSLTARLEKLARCFPRHPDEDAMLESRIPSDVSTEVLTSVECVLHDHLRPAVQILEKASQITEEDLRREFQRRS